MFHTPFLMNNAKAMFLIVCKEIRNIQLKKIWMEAKVTAIKMYLEFVHNDAVMVTQLFIHRQLCVRNRYMTIAKK